MALKPGVDNISIFRHLPQQTAELPQITEYTSLRLVLLFWSAPSAVLHWMLRAYCVGWKERRQLGGDTESSRKTTFIPTCYNSNNFRTEQR